MAGGLASGDYVARLTASGKLLASAEFTVTAP